jgi:hypothetical protein
VRALALIALATTCVATPVIAFDANRVAQATWGAFKTACGQAVTDPQGYINAAPGLAPQGTRPVAASPDGRVVTTSILRNRVEERVQFLGFPGRTMVFCHVHAMDAMMDAAMPDGLAQQLLENPGLMNDPNVLSQLENNLYAGGAPDLRAADAALGDALIQIVSQDQSATLFGGAIPLTSVEDYAFNDGTTSPERNYHSFGIETTFGTVPISAMAEIQYGGLWIGLTHAIEASQ